MEQKAPIHMVLTDVVMPGMSGPQLADQLIHLHPKMKVLFILGYTDNAVFHHGILQGGEWITFRSHSGWRTHEKNEGGSK